MGLSETFNVRLHVPGLCGTEILEVLHQLDVFWPHDVNKAVEALTSTTLQLIPIKKLLLWLEMAKQCIEPGEKIKLSAWNTVLSDVRLL